ncbi:alcohol dehydrogenase [Variovorax sp. YR266]|uniref:alcohol dehydrogenase catalytic domain-containing protein n=1 Tax=Variovorax sp. YR266 TaxID=1884386 RepID=UPI00089528D4|nr:alcohol dehydrogenase catalytic domain-containing protein [Variovorax sp. YR266]SDY34326.1 alcohol dehydrogenase [Variovorax sp. YR266]
MIKETSLPEFKAGGTMRVARMHEIGAPLQIDTLPIPQPGPTDVIVAVKACNVVPNLRNILTHWPAWHPEMPLPALPASFGLDAAGVVAAVGNSVHAFRPGQRVYVNPATGCGGCRYCRSGDILNCDSFTYRGYFGRGPATPGIFKQYPFGGLSEFVVAPQACLVTLPETLKFEEAARFGYLGTGYGALRKADVRPGSTVLINGIGGTLGVNTTMMALAMGASKILGTGRRQAPLDRVKRLAPERIEVLSVQDSGVSIRDWALSLTDGYGVDAVVDTLPPKTPAESTMAAMRAMRTGGRTVLPGGMSEALTLDPFWGLAKNAYLIGSRWFTVAEGQDMATMAAAGTLDLRLLDHKRFGLDDVNQAISAAAEADSGFTNIVVLPSVS